ncbi:MAG: RsmE family RNA methyltransferase [Polyangiaceae bacterium]|nr:RsmE family RNA methyltransferase [Polyangiaceae bacterium]
MNLLLLQPADLDGKHARVEGRRAAHISRVLKKKPGDKVRAGVVNSGTCIATIIEMDETRIELELSPINLVAAPTTHIVLALPRPKVISRVVAAVSSFGVKSLTLINAWRVEKAYFESPRITQERLLEDAILGCEQGAQVWLPEISVERSFRRYVEDLDQAQLGLNAAARVVLHPGSEASLASALCSSYEPTMPVLLALGPEGGFIDAEVASFERAGYKPAELRTGPLRTEVALSAALGQLALLREH